MEVGMHNKILVEKQIAKDNEKEQIKKDRVIDL